MLNRINYYLEKIYKFSGYVAAIFLILIAIFIFGGESIRGFMFALIIGVMVGTYSSVFIATPIMFDSYKKKVS